MSLLQSRLKSLICRLYHQFRTIFFQGPHVSDKLIHYFLKPSIAVMTSNPVKILFMTSFLIGFNIS